MVETKKSDEAAASVTDLHHVHSDDASTDREKAAHLTLKERWSDREFRRKCMKTLRLGAAFVALVSVKGS